MGGRNIRCETYFLLELHYDFRIAYRNAKTKKKKKKKKECSFTFFFQSVQSKQIMNWILPLKADNKYSKNTYQRSNCRLFISVARHESNNPTSWNIYESYYY